MMPGTKISWQFLEITIAGLVCRLYLNQAKARHNIVSR